MMNAAIGTEEDLAVRQAVFELRRTAPKYITFQGQIAHEVLETYGSVNFDPGPIQMIETVRYVSPDTTSFATTNGAHSLFAQTPPQSIESFETDAKAFFTISEGPLEAVGYDRIGVLFGYGIPVEAINLSEWFAKRFGKSSLSSWTTNDFMVRLANPVENGDELLTATALYETGPGGESRYTGMVRVDIDRAFYMLPATELDHVKPTTLHERSLEILRSFLERRV